MASKPFFSSQVSTLGRHAALHPACRPTRPRPPPGPSGNQVCRGSGFAGESGFAEKSGPAGNRDQSEKCSTCANSLAYCGIRMASATNVVALLGQHIRAYGRLYIRVYGRPLYLTLCACNEYTPLSAVSSSRSSAYISPVLATGIG